MAILVDTGILLRAFDANFPDYRAIRCSLRKALDDGIRLVVTVQNISEFWNASTRPKDSRGGQGLSIDGAKRRVGIIESVCQVVSEDLESFSEWKRIVDEYAVMGASVHDARLVSVMLRIGIKEILTLNDRDFKRYTAEGIQALTPQNFLVPKS
jgi:predicted nucleic acid-binding protein